MKLLFITSADYLKLTNFLTLDPYIILSAPVKNVESMPAWCQMMMTMAKVFKRLLQ